MSKESGQQRYRELLLEVKALEDLKKSVGVLSKSDRMKLMNLQNKVALLAPKKKPSKVKPKKDKVMEEINEVKEEVKEVKAEVAEVKEEVQELVKCIEGDCTTEEKCASEGTCSKEGETVVEQLSEKE